MYKVFANRLPIVLTSKVKYLSNENTFLLSSLEIDEILKKLRKHKKIYLFFPKKKDLIKEFVGIDISKQHQSSDFGGELSQAQIKYCANDVVYLHKIHDELDKILVREKRLNLYKDCLKFLKTRVELDLALFRDDIWSH